MVASTKVAVVADSHGLWRPQVPVAIGGADLILHAGDVGRPEVLDRLAEIAPVEAIRGNVDVDGTVAKLPETLTRTVGGVTIHMLHALADLAAEPSRLGWRVVISGHSHKASIAERKGVLYLNPGAIGPKRFSLPVTLAILRIEAGEAVAEIVPLDV